MPAEQTRTLQAGFEDGRAGRLFRVRFAPARSPPAGAVLFVHGLAEEMNRSRHVVAHVARELAAHGLLVEVPDLLGCGDSEGTLAHASIAGWLDDLEDRARALARAVSGPVHLCGMRAGALLAAAAARRLHGCDGAGQGDLVLWQPVAEGRTALRELLRLRTVASLVRDTERESVDGLRQRLADGETLEVAGYPLTPDLAAGLEGLALADLCPGRRRVHWLEVSPGGDRDPAPAGRAVAEAWTADGARVVTTRVAGPAFWSAAELQDCPGLGAATVSALCRPGS